MTWFPMFPILHNTTIQNINKRLLHHGSDNVSSKADTEPWEFLHTGVTNTCQSNEKMYGFILINLPYRLISSIWLLPCWWWILLSGFYIKKKLTCSSLLLQGQLEKALKQHIQFSKCHGTENLEEISMKYQWIHCCYCDFHIFNMSVDMIQWACKTCHKTLYLTQT